jgi:hypothetical protein
MSVNLCIYKHPLSNETLLPEIYAKLIKYHPLTARKYALVDEAVSELKRNFSTENTAFFRVAACFLEKIALDEHNLPDISVTWPMGTKPDTKLFDFLHFCLYSFVNTEYFADIIESLRVDPAPMLGSTVNGRNEYRLLKYYDKQKDWMYYEVQRNKYEDPFTTIIKNYSKNGMKPLFSNLYVSKSWGLLKDDQDFLRALWISEYGNDEEFDIPKLIESSFKHTFPQPGELPNVYPEVYRRSIKTILNLIDFE